MIPDKKWILVQPSHRGGGLSPQNMQWTNDSFRMLSKQFNAPCYHILDENIPLHADAYIICSFDIALIEKEIEFVKKVKENGAKVLVGFSQDLRFLIGSNLLLPSGTLYTELCKDVDIISSGVNPKLGIYGRYQDKVIPFGEVLEDFNWSVPFEQREYDLITCEAPSEYALAFELEFLLLAKERHPDHRMACLIHGDHQELIYTLRDKYPQIEFPFKPGLSLIDYIKVTKTFCNPEMRPRPCRTAMESYYCRVPFISSSWTYHSRLCKEFAYDSVSIVDWVDKYDAIVNSDRDQIIRNMEERAKYDSLESIYARISEKFGW